MPLILVRNDITKMKVDAIVNAANSSLLGGGGVDGAIHRAAGPGLLRECRTLGGCRTGDAKLTAGYDLPAKYVIHTVGPVWRGGGCSEAELLASCYRRSLELAKNAGCESVAFPLISSGVYGYPHPEAFRIAQETVLGFLEGNDMTVYIVFFGRSNSYFENEHLSKLDRLLSAADHAPAVNCAKPSAVSDERGEKLFASASRRAGRRREAKDKLSSDKLSSDKLSSDKLSSDKLSSAESAAADSLAADSAQLFTDAAMCASIPDFTLDESFSEMLLRKIDERGMTDAECYKKANIDRKLFSKIRSDRLYRPSKPTVLAFAIALELSLDETRELLMKAGFALSGAIKFDVIVKYFIERGIYDVFLINEALFEHDQMLLGA